MGPTGAGKTAQSLAMAKANLPICIINADSRQLYKDFPIISAQPSEEEKSICPHKLFGYLETKEASSAGVWLERAKKEIECAHAGGQIPVFVGGTGFYFRALFDGIAEIPDIPEEIHEHFIREITEKAVRLYTKNCKKLIPNTPKKFILMINSALPVLWKFSLPQGKNSATGIKKLRKVPNTMSCALALVCL